MPNTKIRFEVDEAVWVELRELAAECGQSISALLTEAIREYLSRHRVRPDMQAHVDASIDANEELGRLLAE